MARLLPPESSAIDLVSPEVGISVATLKRWRADALADGSGELSSGGGQSWTGAARLKAVIATAAMDEATRSAWCREQGLYPTELDAWKQDAIAALGEPRAASAAAAREDRWRVKELERQLHRKDKALAETAALLMLSKELSAVFQNGESVTRPEDRQILIRDIAQALVEAARLALACALAGIDVRTLQCWKSNDGVPRGDRRPGADRLVPLHTLSETERAQTVAVANEPRSADTPPARIVPALADDGIYLASKSSFHRVLRAHGQMSRRGRVKRRERRGHRPPTLPPALPKSRAGT